MPFARAVWKLLVGIKDALVLVFMLIFFAAIYGALSHRAEPIGSGVLALDLSGSVVEQPSKPGFSDLAGGSAVHEYRLRDLVATLDAARDDDRVKAVALDMERFTGGGQTAMTDLAEAIRRVRASGKPVVAYGVGYTDDSYLVASAASEVWLNPLGAILLQGPGGENLYYKGLLDKLGVTANVYRVGTYKAAVEPFTRNDMSPEAKENAQALGQALLEHWREAVLRNRPKAKVDQYMQNPVQVVAAAGNDLSKAALDNGLVDHLGDREAFEAHLADLGGKDGSSPAGYKAIDLGAYEKDVLPHRNSGSIGVVTVAGMIVDGKAAAGTAGGDSIADVIDSAVNDGDIKALVVRVDSPGGSVLASERIRQAILNAKKHKIPVVTSMGSVAASGGYWVSTPADYIFAEPSTITGSIGVFAVLPSFQSTLQKLGIGVDGIKTTPLSGEPDVLKGPSPEAGVLLQAGVDSIYRQFLSIVAASRHKTPQQIDSIAQGRVWDGGTARQLGLVDAFGGLREAIDKAGQLAKIGDAQNHVAYLERPETFEEKLLEAINNRDSDAGSSDGDAFASLGSDQALANAVAEVRSVLKGPRIQVRCLDCPPVAPARIERRDVGLLSALKAWLN